MIQTQSIQVQRDILVRVHARHTK